jgi:hypothetical protein
LFEAPVVAYVSGRVAKAGQLTREGGKTDQRSMPGILI